MTSQIFTMDRDQLEPLLSRAMTATVKSLQKEGLLKVEDGDKFLSNHMAIMVTKKTVIDKILEYFYPKNDPAATESRIYVTIVKIE